MAVTTRQPPDGFCLAPWQSRRETLVPTGGERWYLVQSLARREPNAEFQLNAQNFRTFLPGFAKTVRHARRSRIVRAPIFAGYIFVILDLDRDQWRSINGTFGVARIVTIDGRPCPVPMGFVESLLEHTDADGLTQLSYSFSPGQSVRIMGGPFASLVGTLDRIDAGGRVRVLLEIMGGAVPVTLMTKGLEPATPEQL